MRVFLLFIFLFSNLNFAQLPISEANAFRYQKSKYGFDFNNTTGVLQILEDGRLLVQPYNGSIYTIGNNKAKTFWEYRKDDKSFQALVKFKNQEIIFFNQKIYIKKDGEFRPVKINIPDIFINRPFINDKYLFFVVYSYKDKKSFLIAYDGKKFINIIKDSNIYLHKIQGKICLLKLDLKKRSHKLYLVEDDLKLKWLKDFMWQMKDMSVPAYFKTFSEGHLVGHKEIYAFNENKTAKIYSNDFDLMTYPVNRNFPFKRNNSFSLMSFNSDESKLLFTTSETEAQYYNAYNKESNSYYVGTDNALMRFFPYIKKYPRLFNKTNSQSIFGLNQTIDGKIWVGSYNAAISVIDGNEVKESNIKQYRILNGNLTIGNKSLMNAENVSGLLLLDDVNSYKKIADSIASFYNYISRDSILYSATHLKGLMFKPLNDALKGKGKWTFVGEKEGITLENCLTLAEDRFGNIWTGRTSEGIAYYNPNTKSAKTWRIDNEIDFGSMAMTTDYKKTLWMGTSRGGLVYYDGKHKNDFNPKNFVKIEHPLFWKSEKPITFIHHWKNYLLLGAYDRILLFDLKKFYENKKISVRYLNPLEANLSNNTEQNTIFTDIRDQSVWFATSDMLYQWDLENWLKLPNYKIAPTIKLDLGSHQHIIAENKIFKLKPTENSLTLEVLYQTKDNLPRFITAQLLKKNKKFLPRQTSTENTFSFQNLSSGDYIFHVLVCQQDGSYSLHQFPITINSFFWQKWWFWLSVLLIPITFFYYYFKNKKEIEIQKKKVAELNLINLGNQFRPHFMLNALNSLGSEFEGKPHAEKILSRIGENINIMYRYVQNNKFYIPFEKEWKLVQNTIDIQKNIFIKDLIFTVNNIKIIPDNYQVPIGIIQIPVENALLHGIRHRKKGPYSLMINVSETADYYIIEIIDNGVGKENSQKFYNFRHNGNGLKNIYSLIVIINSKFSNAIVMDSKDSDNLDEEYPGTKVIVKLHKKINYEKINV